MLQGYRDLFYLLGHDHLTGSVCKPRVDQPRYSSFCVKQRADAVVMTTATTNDAHGYSQVAKRHLVQNLAPSHLPRRNASNSTKGAAERHVGEPLGFVYRGNDDEWEVTLQTSERASERTKAIGSTGVVFMR